MRPIDADALENKIKGWKNRLNPRFYRSDFITKDALVCVQEYISDAPTLDYAPKWISVKDRLPKTNELVLCIGSKGGMFLGCILFDNPVPGSEIYHFHVPNARQGRCATHWMPLPESPKEE